MSRPRISYAPLQLSDLLANSFICLIVLLLKGLHTAIILSFEVFDLLLRVLLRFKDRCLLLTIVLVLVVLEHESLLYAEVLIGQALHDHTLVYLGYHSLFAPLQFHIFNVIDYPFLCCLDRQLGIGIHQRCLLNQSFDFLPLLTDERLQLGLTASGLIFQHAANGRNLLEAHTIVIVTNDNGFAHGGEVAVKGRFCAWRFENWQAEFFRTLGCPGLNVHFHLGLVDGIFD